jgi:hypothetical protein
MEHPNLAAEIEQTLATYSITKNKDGTLSPVELTRGFQLLGTPIGSPWFAHEFFDKQLQAIRAATHSLKNSIPDLQTQMKLFLHCTIQKLPHLLDSDIMHKLPLEYDNDNWHNWNGPLTSGIGSTIHSFLQTSLETTLDLPTYSKLIAHLNTNQGGLGLLNASHRAAPDFVINMMTCKRQMAQGFIINNNILPIKLHISIPELFNTTSNTSSTCLKRYQHLLPHITQICSGQKCQQGNHIPTFETNILAKSAQDRIESHCGILTTGQIYSMMSIEAPEHIHLLPSILSPQTSYPLVGMNRSNSHHRLPNWAFLIAIKQKLRLPIYNINNCPVCKCNTQHDCWGDHTYNCRKISKKAAHNII